MTDRGLFTDSDFSQKTALWTRSCWVVVVCALFVLGVMLASSYQSHGQPPLRIQPQRINPNIASMASLVRLPGVGKARAMDIIHYRQNQLSARDLEAIRGIGPKTAEKLSPWLTFEGK
jgi:Holliday junction resolvasome RuvABC DNA-binding subunit